MSRETSAAAQARLSVGDSRSGAEGLDARCLLVISQVAATGSLSAAAEQLGCSPSTVHQQLAGLQERAGVRLYRRSRGGVVMTSCGAELAAHGQRIHKIVALAADRIERVALAERRILSVVAFRAHPMINVIYYQLARGAAGLRVELDALSAGEAIDRMRGGRSEALFGYGLGGIDADERADDLNATTIVEVPMRVVLHQEHPCANADAVALVDLHEEPWVVADGGTVLHAHTRAACQAVGFEPDIRFAVDRDSVTRLVALRAGVALVCADVHRGAAGDARAAGRRVTPRRLLGVAPRLAASCRAHRPRTFARNSVPLVAEPDGGSARRHVDAGPRPFGTHLHRMTPSMNRNSLSMKDDTHTLPRVVATPLCTRRDSTNRRQSMPEQSAVLSVDDASIEELAGQIRAFEETLDPLERESFNAEALKNLSPLSEAELQEFLEQRSGISPDEEPQGTLMAAAATVAVHC